MKIYLKTILLVLSILLTHAGQAQFYKKGRIVTQQNDTLYGLIRDVGGIWNSRYCQFKENKNSNPVKYHPNEIISYEFNGDKHYSSQRLFIDTTYRDYFFDVLLEGDVNLYYFWKYRSMSYFLQKKDGQLVGLTNEHITVRHPITARVQYDLGYNIVIEDYKDTLRSIFRDCKEVQNKIRDVEYKRKSILKVTKEYIKLTCKKNNCIQYERDSKISKPTVGIFSGVQVSKVTFSDPVYSLTLTNDNAISFPVGIYYNIPLDYFIEGFSFQSEFIFKQLKYDPKFNGNINDVAYVNFHSNVYSFPLLLKYGYRMNKFYPTIGFGKELGFVNNSKFQYLRQNPTSETGDIYAGVDYLIHKAQNGGWFFDFEVTYRVHPKFSIFSGIRVQRQYNLIIEDEYANNYSFNGVLKANMGTKYKTDLASFRVGISF